MRYISPTVHISIFRFFSWIAFIYGIVFSLVLDGETKHPYLIYGIVAAFFLSTLALILNLLAYIAEYLHAMNSKLEDVTNHQREIDNNLKYCLKVIASDVSQIYKDQNVMEIYLKANLEAVANDMHHVKNDLKTIEFQLTKRS
jgi:hypothetical protein